MLKHLKQRVSKILASTKTVTLSTFGPAGIQARVFSCEAQGIHLYLLLPSVSDQLVNLEQDPGLVVSTAQWQLRGTGRILALHDSPDGLSLPQAPQAEGCVLLQIRPSQLQIYRQNGWGFSETFDIDPAGQT
jgi:hypothetical protein